MDSTIRTANGQRHEISSRLFLTDNSLSFLDYNRAIDWNVLQDFLRAAQPFDHYASCFTRASQAEMQSQIALRTKTATAAHFLNLPSALSFHSHSGSSASSATSG